MSRLHLRTFLCTLLVAVLSQQALAHFVWVVTDRSPSDEPSVKVYFGELPKPGDAELLSYIEDVELKLLQPSGELQPISLEAAEVAMMGDPDLGQGIVFGSRDLGEMNRGGSTFALKYHFKAGPEYGSNAWQAASTADHLPLDVVPSRAANGDLVLNVSWEGRPLAGAEIVCARLDAPPVTVAAEDDGSYTLEDPEPGMFGVRVKHAPPASGDELPARHYTTLTFEVPAPLPIHLSRGPDYPLNISSHGAAFHDGDLYAYGGHGGVTHKYSTETTSGRFFRWTPNRFGSNGWEELASGIHVQGMGLVAHDGALYRIGGARPRNAPNEEHDIRSVASCSKYDPETDAWTEVRALPAPRSSFDSILWNDTLIVVGGWEMRGAGERPDWCDTTLMLDLSQPDAEWRSVAQPFERRALGCSVVDDKLYVVGGLTEDGDVERQVDVLDLNSLEWSQAPELPGGRMNGFTPAVCNLAGTLLASPADGQIYRLREDETAWDVVGAIEQSRFVHRMVPIDGRTVALIGGASMQGNRNTVELVEFLDGATYAVDATAALGRAGQAPTPGVQERCPVMRSDFVDDDSTVLDFNGIEIRVCCESCEQRFAREPEAYLDVAVLPQLAGLTLPPRKLEQFYCPVYRDRIVSSADPSLAYDGKTLYFFSNSAKGRFEADPAKYPINDELYRWSGAGETN